MTEVLSEDVKDLQSKGEKLLVQFSASWCGPCKTLTPRLENIEESYSDVTFLKIDVDKNTNAAIEFEIRSVPTVMIFKGDKLIDRSIGVQPDIRYKQILDIL